MSIVPPSSRPRRLAKLGEATLWAVAALALARRLPAAIPHNPEPDPRRDAADKRRELLTYVTGYGLALVLTCAAFALVHWRWVEPPAALAIVFGLGLAQVMVHFRCFLHIDFKAQARHDLALILFSTVIILLMVGGTLVVLFNLRARMM